MIKIDSLEFSYDSREFRLEIGDLSVRRGEAAAVIGPSGSGKTTLLHLVAGIASPRSGSVTTNEVELTELGEAARREFRIANIGLVFQEFELLEYLSVLDNILLPYRISRRLRLGPTIRDRARELAHGVGIGDKLGRLAGRLSQGEKQRVAVCRALLPEPVLLLADEPTGNLDPVNKDRVLDILFDYAEGSGATLLTVTHDYEILERFERSIDCKDFCVVDGAAVEPKLAGAAASGSPEGEP